MRVSRSRMALAGALAALFCSGIAQAAEIKVMISGGFAAAYKELSPGFERATGHTLVTVAGPSMGTAPDAIPVRLQRGEPADVLILVGSALDGLAEQGKVAKGSRVDLARSRIGMVVRKGAPAPDIASVESFKRALLAAKSIAYSDSASGVYVSHELYARLGLAAQLGPKSRMIVSERVGNVVARGEAEIGFQQISELLPVPGVELVGPIPAELQKVTVFSAGVAAAARQPEAARALIRYLSAKDAQPIIVKTGLDPIEAPAPKR